MPRLLSAAMKAAIEGDILYPVYFFAIETASDTLYLWTGWPGQALTWDGHVWIGIGWPLGFSDVEETAEVAVTSMTVGLPANPELISMALT